MRGVVWCLWLGVVVCSLHRVVPTLPARGVCRLLCCAGRLTLVRRAVSLSSCSAVKPRASRAASKAALVGAKTVRGTSGAARASTRPAACRLEGGL